MATSSNPHRSADEKKSINSHYHERNRTFSATTTHHYRNKLAQIGIQKDLREIIERKKLGKEQEKINPSSPTNLYNEASQISRKVRFTEEKIPLRRSKSFTAGTTRNNDYNFEATSEVVREKSPPKKFNRSFKGKRKDFIDLQNPINIKVELNTNSGERKCILDEGTCLGTVKCDLKNCRYILNHVENKEKTAVLQTTPTEKNKEKFKPRFYRSGDRSKSFSKKNKGFSERPIQNEEPENLTTNATLKSIDK